MFEFDDEIVSIEEMGEMELMDIEVEAEDHLFFANGILTHNSAVEVAEYNQSHMAGGISKVNTADNVFAIFSNPAMKEQGLYKLQLLKTRTSAAVGQTIELGYSPVCMRITDPLDFSSNTGPNIKNFVNKNSYKTETDLKIEKVENKAGDALKALREKTRGVAD